MTEVKVHEKYLVVIPKDVRKALGIRIGETVEFVIEKGRAGQCFIHIAGAPHR
jgi:AbrB family looped-hinge helix DNA binding protein